MRYLKSTSKTILVSIQASTFVAGMLLHVALLSGSTADVEADPTAPLEEVSRLTRNKYLPWGLQYSLL